VYINDIVIVSDLVDDYFKYFNTIFVLFVSKNIILLFKKLYFDYLSVELFGFYVNGFGVLTIKERIEAFKNYIFPDNLKVFK
ncbi:hypothetical protein B0H65DRAFT_427180, partial [Neurospora tetraspora]